MMLVMVVGSFFAGVSAAGGGAIAFPAMTLLLGASPGEARDFSMLIQSVGMTAASILIIWRRIPIDFRTISKAFSGGLLGLFLGNYYILPLLSPREGKLAFATVWFSFAIALYFTDSTSKYHRREEIPPGGPKRDLALVFTGAIGGLLTACFGSGADLAIFSFIVLYFGVCEKVATPTSVVLMALLSLSGSIARFHSLAIPPPTLERWMACIPVVLVGAPLGALVCSQLSRKRVIQGLIAILTLQFIGSNLVLRPSVLEGVALTLAGLASLVFFHRLSEAPRQRPS